MAPQFVDFNANGYTDIVTATYDGSPWVSLGSQEGFQQPSHIKHKEGKRILLSRHWDYDERSWTNKDHTDGKAPNASCISCFAFDWDADGDFDLVMGDRNGGLHLCINEGSNKEHKFATVSSPIMIGDEPLNAGGKISSPRLVDWDKDGLTDIVVGTFGDTWGAGEGGGIKWFRNVGGKGEPKFEDAKTLIENSKKDAPEPTRPDAGLYFDVVDWDGDGDWDLLIGGYSLWKAKDADKNTRFNRKPGVWLYLQKDKAVPDNPRPPER